MEKIDVVMLAFVIFAVIISRYVHTLHTMIKYLFDMVNKQTDMIHTLVSNDEAAIKLYEKQIVINSKQEEFNIIQDKINDKVIKALKNGGISSSPTGGGEAEAEPSSK